MEIERKGKGGVVKEKVYCEYMGEHSQSQGPLGESKVDMTLSWAMGGDRVEEREEPGAATRRPRGTKRIGNQNAWII